MLTEGHGGHVPQILLAVPGRTKAAPLGYSTGLSAKGASCPLESTENPDFGALDWEEGVPRKTEGGGEGPRRPDCVCPHSVLLPRLLELCHPPRISVSLMTEPSGRANTGVRARGRRGLTGATDVLPEKHSR